MQFTLLGPAGVRPARGGNWRPWCYRDSTMPVKPGSTKNLLLRLDPDLAERLQTVAAVEGRSVSDVVREAIIKLVEQRRRDKRFLRLLDDNLARHQRVLDLLRDDQL